MKSFIFANAVSRAGKEIMSKVLTKYSINLVEYYILYYLEKNPGSTQYILLKYTTQTKSRVNQVITKLEKKGYVKKKLELVGSLLKKPLYNTELGNQIVQEGLELMHSNTVDKLTPEEREKYELYNREMLKILSMMITDLKVEVPGFFFLSEQDREFIER
jgi:DNA-binding MarR family transcriptional regulator